MLLSYICRMFERMYVKVVPLSIVHPVSGTLGAVHKEVEQMQKHLVVPHQSLANLCKTARHVGSRPRIHI